MIQILNFNTQGDRDMSKEFKLLGLWEKQDVLVGSRNDSLMLTGCTYDLALIREIKGEPLGHLYVDNIAVYDERSVDFHKGNINEVETWKLVVENELLDKIGYEQDSMLRWVLQSKFRIRTEVFDYLYSVCKDDNLDDMLANVNTSDAAKWVYEHGAKLDYDGFSCTLLEYVGMHRGHEHEEICKFIEEKLNEQKNVTSNNVSN